MDRRDRVGTNSCDGNVHDGVLFVDAYAPFAIDDGNLFQEARIDLIQAVSEHFCQPCTYHCRGHFSYRVNEDAPESMEVPFAPS